MVEQSVPKSRAAQNELTVATSNLEAEFNRDNYAAAVMGSFPDKVNFIISLGPLATNNLTQTHQF